MKEAANQIGFGVTVTVEGPVRMPLTRRALLMFQTNPLSNDPNAGANCLCAERITVDARE